MMRGNKLLRKALLTHTANSATATRFLSSFVFTSPVLQSFHPTPQNDAPWLHYPHGDNSDIPMIANFINGTFQSPRSSERDSPRTIPVVDPSTNNVLSYISDSNHLHEAVEAAKNAYPSWSNTPVQQRQRLMAEYAHLLHQKHMREEIAYWITLEQGKTMADAMGDVWRGLEVVEAAARVGIDMLVCWCYCFVLFCFLYAFSVAWGAFVSFCFRKCSSL